MAFKIEFLPDAAREFDKLDGSLKKLAAKQLDKLAERPEIGEALGNRMGIDLTGYRKTYFGKKGYRIVYEIQHQRVVVQRRVQAPPDRRLSQAGVREGFGVAVQGFETNSLPRITNRHGLSFHFPA